MSDLTATNCGCGCETGGFNNSWLWIILLLCCCGGYGGNSGNGFGGDNCILFILLLLCCGGCGGNGNSFGC